MKQPSLEQAEAVYAQSLVTDRDKQKGVGLVLASDFSGKSYTFYIYKLDKTSAVKSDEKTFSAGTKEQNYQHAQQFVREIAGLEAVPFDCDSDRITSPLGKSLELALKNHIDFS